MDKRIDKILQFYLQKIEGKKEILFTVWSRFTAVITKKNLLAPNEENDTIFADKWFSQS